MRPDLDIVYSLWQHRPLAVNSLLYELPLAVNDLNHHEGVFGQPVVVGGRAGEDAIGADQSLCFSEAVSDLGGVQAGLSQRLHDEPDCVPGVAAEVDGS